MIRALVLALCLVGPALAQDASCPDVAHLRDAPEFDLGVTYPKALYDAVVMAEDRTFYDTFYGTSPITQQLARDLYAPTTSVLASTTIELCLALKFADAFSEQEVLTLWLQSRYFGRGCYGVDAASLQLIGKPVGDGDAGDFITLAALATTPVRGFQDADHLRGRFAMIATAGVIAGLLSPDEREAILAQGPSPLSGNSCTE